jgi:4-aminobutyrate aminotransferase / (S)-3-amino-2-methylpropionate transaminase / 5-aminovalerate transaminase
VIEAIEEGELAARAEDLGERFRVRAKAWQKRLELVGDVRGLGAMQAIELVRSRQSREPAKQETEYVIRYACEHGVLLISAGSYGNVVRILVPLTISEIEFEEGLDVLEAALESVSQGTFQPAAYSV